MLEYTLTQINNNISGKKILYCIDTSNTCIPNIEYTSTVYSPKTGNYYFRYQITSGAGKSSGGSYYAIVNDTTYCAVNLITNGSFENGIDEWGNRTENATYTAGNYSAYGIQKYGNNTFRIEMINDTQTFARANYPNVNNLQGHKVYAKVSAYREHSFVNPGIYLEFTETSDYWSNPSYSQSLWYHDVSDIPAHQWVDISIYENSAPYNYFKIMLAQSLGTGSKGGIIHFDGLMMIDLTDTFGTGNEPNKEWCDNNLFWFEGKRIIYE